MRSGVAATQQRLVRVVLALVLNAQPRLFIEVPAFFQIFEGSFVPVVKALFGANSIGFLRI